MPDSSMSPAEMENRYKSVLSAYLSNRGRWPVLLRVRLQQPYEPKVGVPPTITESLLDEIRDGLGEARYVHPVRHDIESQGAGIYGIRLAEGYGLPKGEYRVRELEHGHEAADTLVGVVHVGEESMRYCGMTLRAFDGTAVVIDYTSVEEAIKLGTLPV
ncbi:MAG: hypothetical protein HY518_04645 [Candidatus Aenigmarchaeota archaeon]|nr:hypothetical protein [Candidatus Aenigmarchaeota archaeon]